MKKPGSQATLKKSVLEQSLCTGCGACVGLCPYQVIHADRTVQLFDCDLPEGKCSAFCPRTPADLDALRKSLYDAFDLTDEIGPVRDFLLTRAADPELRACAQHGGTVTALLQLAMNEGLIDAAIVSGQNDEHECEGRFLDKREALRDYAQSRFFVSPTIAAFNRLPESDGRKIGVVATSCQAIALAKMKTAKIDGYAKTQSLGLVIGLFCGWTLATDKFRQLLVQYGLPVTELRGMDIPAGKNVLELQTSRESIEVPMTEVDACIRTACRYCMDSTAEFADVSVGAARYGDIDKVRGWNQMVVRSSRGEDLIRLAREKKILEIRQAPEQALRELKNAAAEKKKKALKNIVEKSGSKKNLLYLKSDDPVVKKYLK